MMKKKGWFPFYYAQGTLALFSVIHNTTYRVFLRLPESVRQELQILCVLFTEEVGGILTLEFLRDGTLILKTMADDYDYYYDEIEAGIQVGKLRKEKEELFESLEEYYRIFVLKGMDPGTSEA